PRRADRRRGPSPRHPEGSRLPRFRGRGDGGADPVGSWWRHTDVAESGGAHRGQTLAREEDGAMPQTPHVERHFTAGATVRDIVIGMSDGLTVPFALAAGLSGAVDSTRIVITAGLAEIAAGSIAMGLGGYLAAKSDLEHYDSELAREQREVVEKPEAEVGEVE